MDDFDALKLENQLCFPLYVCSKEIIKQYKIFLDKIDLTYTQYIAMMVLWDKKEINVKDLGTNLFLDSGTLTPLLKKLEKKGYVKRKKASNDERNLIISITDLGLSLREKAKEIPTKVRKSIEIKKEDALQLHNILYKMLSFVEEHKHENDKK